MHIILPSLIQLKSISERFTKLATDAKASSGSAVGSVTSPKLELSANMHGSLRLGIATDALRISSVWTDLVNPPLDPGQFSEEEIAQLPSERMRAIPEDDERGWAKVRIDGKDWGRVLSVGRLSPKVVACEYGDSWVKRAVVADWLQVLLIKRRLFFMFIHLGVGMGRVLV